MDLLSKYANVFRLGKKINIKNGKVAIVDGKIKLQGEVNTLFEKNSCAGKSKALVEKVQMILYLKFQSSTRITTMCTELKKEKL